MEKKRVSVPRSVIDRLNAELPDGVHPCLGPILVDVDVSEEEIQAIWDEITDCAIRLCKESREQAIRSYPEKFLEEKR